MDEEPPTEDRSPSLALTASRESAVARLTTGMTTIYVGGASLVVAVLADVMGFATGGVQILQLGATLALWTGALIMASGLPHLLRFGTRRSVAALSSFAAAGLVGLIAVAETFESIFLDSNVLAGLDEGALVVATILVVVGVVLLGRGPHSGARGEHTDDP